MPYKRQSREIYSGITTIRKKTDFKATVLLDIFKIKILFIVTKGSIQQEHINIILNLYAPNNSNIKKESQAKTIRTTRKNKSTISDWKGKSKNQQRQRRLDQHD